MPHARKRCLHHELVPGMAAGYKTKGSSHLHMSEQQRSGFADNSRYVFQSFQPIAGEISDSKETIIFAAWVVPLRQA
jgi:hypothetical protein